MDYCYWSENDLRLIRKAYKNTEDGRPINWPIELIGRHSLGSCYLKAKQLGINNPIQKQLTNWENITETDLAYMAGIIDGEGCLNISKTRKYRYCRLTIANTDKFLMKWLVDKFGAGAQNREHRRSTEERKNRKPCYIFLVAAQNELHELLIRVEKYLVIKKVKARECIDYIETVLWKVL